ncbi:MAG TPA: hypothetical protein VGL40_08980 [Bacillota bacterium]
MSRPYRRYLIKPVGVLLVAAGLLLVLAFFTPQGAVRRYLVWSGDPFDALTVHVRRDDYINFGGRQYFVAGYLVHHPDRMDLCYFYVKRTGLGICVVVSAGTGP